MKDQIKQLRVRLDGLAQLVRNMYMLPPPTFKFGSPNTFSTANLPTDEEFQAKIKEMQSVNAPIAFLNTEEMEIHSLTSGELEKCYDSLRLGKAWLGKLLGSLGEASPYVNDGKRKTVDDIEPAADKSMITLGTDTNPMMIKLGDGCSQAIQTAFADQSYIGQIDWLREEIKKAVDEIVNLDLVAVREVAIARTNAYTHLSEARFWLGFELERIREQG